MIRSALLARFLAGCHSRGPACYSLHRYILLTAATVSASCTLSVDHCEPADGLELVRTVPSASGARSVRILRANGGATTSYGTVVCLVDPGGRTSFVASSERSQDVTAVWEGDTVVVTGLASGFPADRIDVADPGPLRFYPMDGSVGCGSSACPPHYRCEQSLCVLER